MPKSILQCKNIHMPQTSLWNNYVIFVVLKLAVRQVSLQESWFSAYQHHSTNAPYSFICLSLVLYNLSNCQLHCFVNTKINTIIINGSYSKNEVVICVCTKVRAYWKKWQNGGFQSHIRVSTSKLIRYDACSSSERTEMDTWF